MAHQGAQASFSRLHFDHPCGSQLVQRSGPDAPYYAGGGQARAPETHRVLAALRKNHAVKFDQHRPGWPADAVATVKLKTPIVRDARERLRLPLTTLRQCLADTLPGRRGRRSRSRLQIGAQLLHIVKDGCSIPVVSDEA
jgi:hypothetical protein